MIKKIIAIATLLTSITAAAGPVCQYNPGETRCGEGTVADVHANGTANLNGTTVTGDTIVNGTLHSHGAKLARVDVNGSACIKDSQVSQTAMINGTLKSQHSTFASDIRLGSTLSTLDHTNTVNIDVTADSSGHDQLIYVSDASTVQGDITFNSGKGIVYLSKDSKITGQVRGGKIINK